MELRSYMEVSAALTPWRRGCANSMKEGAVHRQEPRRTCTRPQGSAPPALSPAPRPLRPSLLPVSTSSTLPDLQHTTFPESVAV